MTPEQEQELETRLDWIIKTIAEARPVPLSASVMVNREELLALLNDLKAALPRELKQARWMLRERDDFIARTRKEAQDILDEAQLQAERKVSQTDIVAEAVRTADRILEEARETARKLRLEAEDYVDQRLANFETVLSRIHQTVQKGRERLRATPPVPEEELAAAQGMPGAPGPFQPKPTPYDQDEPDYP
jgi:cell division septum initiation protein DivIVA